MSQASQRLEETLKELGISAKRSLGQNFLVSDTVIERIIQQVKDFNPEQLIEVGPGPGALTFFLKQMNVPLTLIELDSVIAEYWKGQGLSVFEEDALRLNWEQFYSERKTVFVSNLPYQISSSIVIERSLEKQGVESMVLMFQKEVAQRIRAIAKSEHYGLLSVIAQVFWKTALVSEAGPRDFNPPPRVASRVLSFSRLASDIQDRKKFLNFVKAGFAQRRKLLKSNLSSFLRQRQVSEPILVEWLAKEGFKETARAEELSPDQFVKLYKDLGLNQ